MSKLSHLSTEVAGSKLLVGKNSVKPERLKGGRGEGGGGVGGNEGQYTYHSFFFLSFSLFFLPPLLPLPFYSWQPVFPKGCDVRERVVGIRAKRN